MLAANAKRQGKNKYYRSSPDSTTLNTSCFINEVYKIYILLWKHGIPEAVTRENNVCASKYELHVNVTGT